MRPTRWRRSTHVLVGVAVLLVVAAVVAVGAVLTGGHSTSDANAIPPAPALATANPGIKPLADSVPKPTPDKLGGTTQSPYVIVEDVDAVYGKAKVNGAEIVREIRTESYGGRGVVCLDPEGPLGSVGSYRAWAHA